MQYFTVLQTLRIARQWIDENNAEWEKSKEDLLLCTKYYPNLASVADGQSLDEQVDKVTQLLNSQTAQLRNRIDRKTAEVQSLRDGVGHFRFHARPSSHSAS